MEKEYLILDSNNNWYITTDDKEEALTMFKEIVDARDRGDTYGIADEVGEDIWLFEANTIKSA